MFEIPLKGSSGGKAFGNHTEAHMMSDSVYVTVVPQYYNSCKITYNFTSQWLRSTFLVYLDGWKKEIDALPGLEPKEKSRMLLSRETQEGLRITSKCTTLTLQAQY